MFATISQFIQQQQLPPSYQAMAQHYILPLAHWINEQAKTESALPLIVGVNGAQGSGKTTLCALLVQLLRDDYKRNTVALSIDDFYLPKAQRQQLAMLQHPLLATRGVPGTHDLPLALGTLDSLRQARAGDRILLPRFDKAEDDRRPSSDFDQATGPVDIVLLEGWCLGFSAQSAAELNIPVNTLEREEDPYGEWRRFVNQQLAQRYPAWFDQLDLLIQLKAPSFDVVAQWRWQQEQRLMQQLAQGQQGDGVMNQQQVERFVAHYERLTRSNLDSLSQRADVVISLGPNREVTGLKAPY